MGRHFALAPTGDRSDGSSMRVPLACVLLLASSLPARAGLFFEKTVIDAKPESGATHLTVKFPFKNTGNDKVTLVSTESDCGCTTATLDKKVFQPGESGVITVNFAIGERIGPQEKKVRVRASDQTEPHVLTFKTDIPVFARVQPQFVYWANGEPPTVKSMVFELIDTDSPIQKLTAVSNNPAIKPEVREIEKGRKYEIAVTPGATEKFLLATIQLTAQLASGKPARQMQAYATIKPGPPAN
ncbi:hypothetical protein AYO41_05205 [Verrucomicrobia bacterium SCGC AG-212-E04]|nr:hypothetical protein AYO41_05205 [Verrucomicrobia bacterium SCGC AG-212-E04]